MSANHEIVGESSLTTSRLGGDNLVAATVYLRGDSGRPQRMTMIRASVATDELDAPTRMTMLREDHRA